jgi:hypothetical protein
VLLGLGLSSASAEPARPQFKKDGSVQVGTRVFRTTNEYVRSDVFRERGKCGSTEPVLTQSQLAAIAATDCSLNRTVINPEYDDDRTLVIQVVVHVIKRTDGVGDIPPEMVQSQIDILNEDFDALAGTPGAAGANAKLRFVLAKFDPDGNPTTGIDYVTNDTFFQDPGSSRANPMKQQLHWDTTRYLNIYTNDADGLLGYATFPSEEAGGPEDGVVVLWDSFGRNSPIGPPYNLGRTTTHEVGHYLGLLHTFQSGCGTTTSPYSTGDLISDTAREAEPNFGCEPTASTCSGGGMNPIENYMDYSEDACMTKFTQEQTNRVRCSIINFRNINTEPIAGFSFTTEQLSAVFTSTSTDVESQDQLVYNWTFGDGQTSTEQNPVHAYTAAGTYEVTLEVIDPGSGTNKITQSVTVDAPASGDDAGTGGGGGGGDNDGGGCCQTPRGNAGSFAALAGIVLLVLRRRRR